MLRVILRRALPCVFVLLALSAPVFAQAPAQTELDPRALLPADIDAWLSLDIRDSGIINALNVAARSAALLQPGRAGLQPLQGLEQALPLQQLNTEALPIFARDFAPWVEEQVLLAWRAPGPAAQSPLLILPTRDVLQAAASFSSILEEQDLLRRELHQGQTLWLADRSSIAFAPGAVLIGPEALVRAALDVQAAAAPRLLDAAAGMTERDAAPAGQILSGWLRGEKTLRALAALLSGSEESAPLLSAFGQTLAAFDSQSLLQQLVLQGEAQALTFSLATDALRLNVLRLTLQLHHDDAAASETPTAFNAAVLEAVPRNAMLVVSGTEARSLVFNLLAAMPLSNFGGQLLGAFSAQESAGAGNGLLAPPDADTIQQTISNWLAALWDQADFDLEHDLLRRLNGSFSLALLPRPNDPLPPLNIPVDLLLVAEVDDGQAVLDALERLVTLTLDARGLERREADGTQLRVLPGDGFSGPLLQAWSADGLLLLGTGAAPEAMRLARAGDDRLIDRARWQALAQEAPPQLYLDIAPLYATLLPGAAGPQLQQIRQLGLRSHAPAAGRQDLEITLTLPGLFG